MNVQFTTDPVDMDLIGQIVARAERQGLIFAGYERSTCRMDLSAAHANGSPLDLQGLLAADDFSFVHDVCGIARHINRETGGLDDFFSPRFSAKAEAL